MLTLGSGNNTVETIKLKVRRHMINATDCSLYVNKVKVQMKERRKKDIKKKERKEGRKDGRKEERKEEMKKIKK